MSELAISLLLAVTTLAASAGLLRTQWERTRCAHLTFEATHARLIGSTRRPGARGGGDSRVRLHEDGRAVYGEGRCGTAHETVELPRLEPAADEDGRLAP